MPEAPLLGGSTKVTLDDAAFAARFHEPLVHQSVRAEQAARRRGTAATRTRGMVSGGGAKPWRQKGTGRARAGSSRSPLWTGGGTVFGPQPRSYAFKVNRKERRAALRSALSLHASRGSIALFDPSAFDAPKTKQARAVLDDWGQPRPTLVVLSEEDSEAALSFRNLPRVAVLRHEDVGVSDLLGAASLLLSQPALEALTERATAGVRVRAGKDASAATPSAGKQGAATHARAAKKSAASVGQASEASAAGASAAGASTDSDGEGRADG